MVCLRCWTLYESDNSLRAWSVSEIMLPWMNKNRFPPVVVSKSFWLSRSGCEPTPSGMSSTSWRLLWLPRTGRRPMSRPLAGTFLPTLVSPDPPVSLEQQGSLEQLVSLDRPVSPDPAVSLSQVLASRVKDRPGNSISVRPRNPHPKEHSRSVQGSIPCSDCVPAPCRSGNAQDRTALAYFLGSMAMLPSCSIFPPCSILAL